MVGELRNQARQDLKLTIQSDFGQNIRLATDQADSEFKTFIGNSNDIQNAFDPETGQMFSGRKAHATLLIDEVVTFFGKLPEKGWRVQFLELSPNEFAVKEPPRVDASQGVMILVVGN